MAQHYPYVAPLQMFDSLQCTGFFWRQRNDAQCLLGNRNQFIQFTEFQFPEKLRRMRTFVLWRKLRAFKITAQHLRARSTGMVAMGNTLQRLVNIR